MKQHYELLVKNLVSDLDIKEYKTLLKEEWDNNAYYSFEYLTYFTNNAYSKLKYFLFKSIDAPIILMPFILREIRINEKETSYFDVVSPYGYSGPLFKDAILDENIVEFWKHVDSWYKENNVITEFIRFSLNDYSRLYSGTLVPALKNVKGVIVNEEEQWSKFKPKVRNNHRRSIQYGLTLEIYYNPIPLEVIKDFYDIYILTMQRNNADNQFFHYIDYFEKLITENEENSIIAMVYKDSKPISTELILTVNNTIYSYLGGTLSEYFYTRPNDFLKIEVMNWARERGIEHYVLGGGREDDDGLYKYKKAFFPNDEDIIFKTGQKIINQKVYDELCHAHNSEEYVHVHKTDFKNCFFPFYRLNDEK